MNLNAYRACGRLNKLCFGEHGSWNKRSCQSVQRFLHVSSVNCGGTIWEPDRKGGRQWHRADPNPLSKKEHIKRGAKMIIPEAKKMVKELQDHFSQDPPKYLYPQEGVVDKYFEFGGPESLDNWVVTCDSDWDMGYSTADVSISPSGSGIFSGNICTQTPKTGKIHLAGYANLRFVPPTRSFYREHTYVFVAYTHLALRIRGDGRTYIVNLHPHTMFDMTYMDMHSYILHTRGGPYWQETLIPFSKFFLHHKGRMHDQQYPIDLQEVKNMSISLMDQNDGPFRLEIDYVGCIQDQNHNEEFAYELYHVGRWMAQN